MLPLNIQDIVRDILRQISPFRPFPQQGLLSIPHDFRGILTYSKRRHLRKVLHSLIHTLSLKNKDGITQFLRLWNDSVLQEACVALKIQEVRIANAVGPLLWFDTERSDWAYCLTVGHIMLMEEPRSEKFRNHEDMLENVFQILNDYTDFTLAGHNIRDYDIAKNFAGRPDQKNALLSRTILDTYDLAVLVDPFQFSYKLADLADLLHIDANDIQYHSASGDVIQSIRIFSGLLQRILQSADSVVRKLPPIEYDWLSEKAEALHAYVESANEDQAETNQNISQDLVINLGVNTWHPEPEYLLQSLRLDNKMVHVIPQDWILNTPDRSQRLFFDKYLHCSTSTLQWLQRKTQEIQDPFFLRQILAFLRQSRSKHPAISRIIWRKLASQAPTSPNYAPVVDRIREEIRQQIQLHVPSGCLHISAVGLLQTFSDRDVVLWDGSVAWHNEIWQILHGDVKTLCAAAKIILENDTLVWSPATDEKRFWLPGDTYRLVRLMADNVEIDDIVKSLAAFDNSNAGASQQEIDLESFYLYQGYTGVSLIRANPNVNLLKGKYTAVFRGFFDRHLENDFKIYYGILGYRDIHQNHEMAKENSLDQSLTICLDPTVRPKTEWNTTAFGRDAWRFSLRWIKIDALNIIVQEDKVWHEVLLEQNKASENDVFIISEYKIPDYWSSTRVLQKMQAEREAGKVVIYLCTIHAIPQVSKIPLNVIMPAWISHDLRPSEYFFKKFVLKNLSHANIERDASFKDIENLSWLDAQRTIHLYLHISTLQRKLRSSNALVTVGSKTAAFKPFADLLQRLTKLLSISLSEELSIAHNSEKSHYLPEIVKFEENLANAHRQENNSDRQLLEREVKIIAKMIFKRNSFRRLGSEEYDQSAPMLDVLQGRDTLVIAATGTGKSLIYQIPAVLLANTQPAMATIVISPLISLMKDQVESLMKNGVFAATFVNSLLDYDQKRKRLQAYYKGYYSILFIAPEALSTRTLGYYLEARPPSLVVLDEAHCVSQWGHDFRPDYLRVATNLKTIAGLDNAQPSDWVTLALTATARDDSADVPGSTLEDIKKYLHLGGHREYRFYPSDTRRRELRYVARRTTDMTDVPIKFFQNIDAELRANLSHFTDLNREFEAEISPWLEGQDQEWPYRQRYIVYCQSKKQISKLVIQLRSQLDTNSWFVDEYHADLKKDVRDSVQNNFTRGRLNLIVATSAFGMGIDVPNVRAVVHLGLPSTIEDYYQQAGRAGRDKNPALCCLFFDGADFERQLSRIRREESVALLSYRCWLEIRKIPRKLPEIQAEIYKTVQFSLPHLAGVLGVDAKTLEGNIHNIFHIFSEMKHNGNSLVEGKIQPVISPYEICDNVNTRQISEREVSFLLMKGAPLSTSRVDEIAHGLREQQSISIRHPMRFKINAASLQGKIDRIIQWLQIKFMAELSKINGDLLPQSALHKIYAKSQTDTIEKISSRINAIHEWMLAHASSLGRKLRLRQNFYNLRKDNNSEEGTAGDRGLKIETATEGRGIREYEAYIRDLKKQIEASSNIFTDFGTADEIDLFQLIQRAADADNGKVYEKLNLNTLESLVRLFQRFHLIEVQDILIQGHEFTVRVLASGDADILKAIKNSEHIANKKYLDYFKLDCLAHYAVNLADNHHFDAQTFFDEYFSGTIKASSLIDGQFEKIPMLTDRTLWFDWQREIFLHRSQPVLLYAQKPASGRSTTLAIKVARKIHEDISLLGRYAIIFSHNHKTDAFIDHMKTALKEHLGAYADALAITNSWTLSSKMVYTEINDFTQYNGVVRIKPSSNEENEAPLLTFLKSVNSKKWPVAGRLLYKGQIKYWDFATVPTHDIRLLLRKFLEDSAGTLQGNDTLLLALVLMHHHQPTVETCSLAYQGYSLVTDFEKLTGYLAEFLNILYKKMAEHGVRPDIIIERGSKDICDHKGHKLFGIMPVFKTEKFIVKRSPFTPKDMIAFVPALHVQNNEKLHVEDFIARIRATQVDLGRTRIIIEPSLRRVFDQDRRLSQYLPGTIEAQYHEMVRLARININHFRSHVPEGILQSTFVDDFADWQAFENDSLFLSSRILPDIESLDEQSVAAINSHKIFILSEQIEKQASNSTNWREKQFLLILGYCGPGDIWYITP